VPDDRDHRERHARRRAVGPAAGDYAVTSHATGLGSIFVSDGTKWQFLTNA
jgi:hypothetical protein